MNHFNKAITAIIFALLVATHFSANCTVIYTYTGNAFDQAAPPHVIQLGNHMTVTLTFADLLPANAVDLAACTSGCAATVLDFNAQGGGPIFSTPADGGQMLTGHLSTDSTGNIVGWGMTFLIRSFAIVTASTPNTEPDLPVPVFDLGETQNTHWGASTKGTWSFTRNEPVDSPGALSLLALGLFTMIGRRKKNAVLK
jgi:hypothetical protein